MHGRMLWSAWALAALVIPNAWAASDAQLEEIRAQIRELKQTYEARIQALEERLKAAEEKEAAAATLSPALPQGGGSTPTAPQGGGSTPTAAQGGGSNGLAAFNPAISAILNGRYANLSLDPERYRLAGFAPAPDAGPGRRGFSLGESELAFSANVDPMFSGALIFSVTPDDTVSVEEAYGIFNGAPAGIVPKLGRFFSGLGYLNEQHAHAWDFIDAPLAYDAFLGGQYRTNGLQLSWIAPTDQFVQLGAEVGNTDSFPGTARDRNGAGSGVVFARTGGDVGESHSWLAGVSYLRTAASERSNPAYDPPGLVTPFAFTGRSEVAAADFVWKWAPNGNPHATNFKLQGEYLWRREHGDLTSQAFVPAPASAHYASRQDGWYVQGVYQFMPLWRAGLRYDRLDPGSVDLGDLPGIPSASSLFFPASTFHPERATAMVDWSPSEFSRVRLQFAQAKPAPGLTDNEWFLQYILSIGAHGAHKY